MARNTVVVSITASAKGLKDALGDSESALGKFGGIAAGVAAAATAAVGLIGVKAVKSASELQQSMGALESVFKDQSGVMTDFAKKAANTLGLAQSDYAQLAAVLGSQLKNLGVPMGEIAGQTNSLITLGADLSAQFGGSTSDAVSALSALFRGERDPIERYGVSIKDADVKARLAEMGLSGLTGEALKQATTMATLSLLTQQTADAQGAFSRESDTLAGAFQRMQAGAENLYAALGLSLLPAVTAVAGGLSAVIAAISGSDAFAAFTQKLTDGSNAFADFIYGLIDGTRSIDLSTLFTTILTAAIEGIGKVGTFLATGGAKAIVDGLVSAREALFAGAMQTFPVILDAIVKAVPQIISGLVSMVTQLAQMLVEQAPVILGGAVLLFTGLLDGLVTVLPTLINAIITLLPTIVETILTLIPLILNAAIQLFTALVEALPVVIPLLITGVIGLLDQVITTLIELLPLLLQAAVDLFKALVDAIPIILPLLTDAITRLLPKIIQATVDMLPAILDAAIQLFTALVDALPIILPALLDAVLALGPGLIGTVLDMVPDLLSAGGDLIQGLVDGLIGSGDNVVDALLGIAEGAIESFKNFFGIKSPSRLFMKQGVFMGQGLAIGIGKSERYITSAMDSMQSLVGGYSTTLAPDIAMAGDYGSSGQVINVTVNAGIGDPVEIGRSVVEAINAYQKDGGRQ